MSDFDALIVGAGPSGLAAAIAIRKRLEANVVLIEREREAGGIARHTNHSGYGWRDFHRVMRGPAYVQRYQTLADKAGVELRLSTSAVEWTGDRSLKLVSAGGVEDVTARSIVLATGCRERSRPARLIAGDRPDGVLTTGMLQQLVELYGARAGAPGSPIGHRAVVIGAEHVSFSAVMTLRHAGCTTAAMVTDLGRHQSAAALRWSAAPRVRIHYDVTVRRIIGRGRPTAVELSNGARIACDTVVVTGDWIADHELARHGGLSWNRASTGVMVDGGLRTDRSGVFAIGNLVHPAETADVCALDGRAVATTVERWLTSGQWSPRSVELLVQPPLRWIHPGLVEPKTTPPRNRFVLRLSEFVTDRSVRVTQNGVELWAGKLGGALTPSRSVWIRANFVSRIDPQAGPATVSLP